MCRLTPTRISGQSSTASSAEGEKVTQNTRMTKPSGPQSSMRTFWRLRRSTDARRPQSEGLGHARRYQCTNGERDCFVTWCGHTPAMTGHPWQNTAALLDRTLGEGLE